MKKLTISLITFFMINACATHDLSPASRDHLAFGVFSNCYAIPCRSIFVIEDNKLFEADIIEPSAQGKPYGLTNFQQRSSSDYATVAELETSIPDALLAEQENFIGCPGCADGSAVYIEITRDGVSKFWMIDPYFPGINNDIKNYVGLLRTKYYAIE